MPIGCLSAGGGSMNRVCDRYNRSPGNKLAAAIAEALMPSLFEVSKGIILNTGAAFGAWPELRPRAFRVGWRGRARRAKWQRRAPTCRSVWLSPIWGATAASDGRRHRDRADLNCATRPRRVRAPPVAGRWCFPGAVASSNGGFCASFGHSPAQAGLRGHCPGFPGFGRHKIDKSAAWPFPKPAGVGTYRPHPRAFARVVFSGSLRTGSIGALGRWPDPFRHPVFGKARNGLSRGGAAR